MYCIKGCSRDSPEVPSLGGISPTLVLHAQVAATSHGKCLCSTLEAAHASCESHLTMTIYVQACEAAKADTASSSEEAERLRSACKAADAECARLRRKLKDMAEESEGVIRAMQCILYPGHCCAHD